MSYKSPIEFLSTQPHYDYVNQQADKMIMSAIQKVGINVDKDELIKALNYDREQYQKGFNDATVHAHWIVSERKPNFFCGVQGARFLECSNCGDSFLKAASESISAERYCRNCGARMDEEIEYDKL